MDDTLDPTPDPARESAPAASGDGAHAGDTLDMSQVAGERPVPALLPDEATGKKKKKKDKEMRAVAATPPLSAADQNLADLGTKRGIETMFRSAYRVNMDLSSLADSKANIMISINGLIVSILIASIAPGMEKNPWLYIPTSLFLVGCLVSLVFAVLGARPRVHSNHVTRESAMRNRTNILFFGNFGSMDESDYVATMKDMVQDPTLIYEMMMKDIYGVGSVLERKYLMLRASYTSFLVALVVGVVGFIIVFGYAAFLDPTGASMPTTTTGPVPGILP